MTEHPHTETTPTSDRTPAGVAPATGVVVGVDGSVAAEAALGWAAHEAARRELPLRIVFVFPWPVPRFTSVAEPLRRDAEELLDRARARCVDRHPELSVSVELRTGSAAAELIEASRGAQLLVVGGHGHGGVAATLLGSVPATVAAHAVTPVVVVRGDRITTAEAWTGDVVAGIDGSPTDEPILGAAFEAAAARSGRLTVVHAWADVMLVGAVGETLAVQPEWHQLDVEAHEVVDRAVAPWVAKYPEVTVEREVVRDGAVRTLLEHSERAALIVVGARGRGGFAALLLGSVARAVATRSGCPVEIVPREG